MNNTRRIATSATFLLGVLTMTGCYATKGSVRTQVEQLRQEIQAGDQAVTQHADAADQQLAGRVGTIEQDVQRLRTELNDLNVKVTRLDGLLAFAMPIHFAFGKADLRESDKAVLKRFANVVREVYPDALLTAEGFTDQAGNASYNLRLGKQRAETVRDYLVSDGGINGDQIRTVSYGESVTRLVDQGATGPGENGASNRRVVIVLDYVGTAADATRPITN